MCPCEAAGGNAMLAYSCETIVDLESMHESAESLAKRLFGIINKLEENDKL